MIRLFVALDVPETLRERMEAMCGGVPDARWVGRDNLHITLRFIGEVYEPTADDIMLALARVRCPPFPVTLAGAGHFETAKRVRALWLGVERTPELTALQGRIESAVQRAGVTPEGRKFVPHVTLARLKNGAPAAAHRWLAANSLFRAMPFLAERFVLYSSHRGSEGAIYTAECAFPLLGPGAEGDFDP